MAAYLGFVAAAALVDFELGRRIKDVLTARPWRD
jgi:hypothetical protein